MSKVFERWFSNSFFNLIGGLATAGVNLLLPAIVVKHLTGESFSVWNLALQMMVYVNLLSLGLQTATARAVAHAGERNEIDGDNKLPTIVRAARSISNRAAGAAFLFVLILVIVYPQLFPGVPVNLVGDFRLTIALFGLSAVIQILPQVDMGVFQGLHRNVVFVSVQMIIRLFTVLIVWVGVRTEQPMTTLAFLMASSMALLGPAMRTVFKRMLYWSIEVNTSPIDKILRQNLLKYCFTLSVWSLSMLLVNTVGIVIVGRFDFLMVGPYAIAMTATSVLVGLLGAFLSPLMTVATSLYSSQATRAELPKLLMRSTVLVLVGLNLIFAIIMVLHDYILRLWVGESFVESTGPILLVLIGGHCLRNIAAPYALMLLATGQHQKALISALLEGISNLIASIVFGVIWGAMGVAFGTVVGAIIGIVGTLSLNMARTPDLTPKPVKFIFNGILLPQLVVLPIYVYLITVVIK